MSRARNLVRDRLLECWSASCAPLDVRLLLRGAGCGWLHDSFPLSCFLSIPDLCVCGASIISVIVYWSCLAARRMHCASGKHALGGAGVRCIRSWQYTFSSTEKSKLTKRCAPTITHSFPLLHPLSPPFFCNSLKAAADGFTQGHRHAIAYLSIAFLYASTQHQGIGNSLYSCSFPDAERPIRAWVEHRPARFAVQLHA
jgi:hypothetical protein